MQEDIRSISAMYQSCTSRARSTGRIPIFLVVGGRYAAATVQGVGRHLKGRRTVDDLSPPTQVFVATRIAGQQLGHQLSDPHPSIFLLDWCSFRCCR